MVAAQELVCVVDDDQSVRRGIRRLFKSAGYSAETFASAEDYLAREVFAGPICLVLDVYMPGLNGLALQHQLESRGTAEQIVFITGHGDVPTCTQAMGNGAVDFLMKPFDDHELIDAVARALERAKESLRRRAERCAAALQNRQVDPARIRSFALRHFGHVKKTDRSRTKNGGKDD
jgi:FixJ family two-component response regulator